MVLYHYQWDKSFKKPYDKKSSLEESFLESSGWWKGAKRRLDEDGLGWDGSIWDPYGNSRYRIRVCLYLMSVCLGDQA